MGSSLIRVGFAVVPSRVNQPDANKMVHEQMVSCAALDGVSILSFPELSLTGYGLSSSAKTAAEPIPGPGTDFISSLACRYQITLLAGILEAETKDTLFLSQIVCYPNGRTGVYRKLHMAPPEQAFASPGHRIPIFKGPGLTFGVQLCYDAHFPELTTVMTAAGIDLLIIPHASPRGTPEEKIGSWMRHLTARAFDNSIYVIAGNPVGTNGGQLSFPGVALAIDPSGRCMKTCQSTRHPALMTIDLDRGLLSDIRQHPMRHFFPNRRLNVDTGLIDIVHVPDGCGE